MIKKIKEYLVNNVILTVFLSVMCIIVSYTAWKWIMCFPVGRVDPINSISEQNKEHTENNSNASSNKCFEYTPTGILYHSASGVDAGPFKFLYTDEFYYSWDTVARYIGDNGMYGYLSEDGSLLTEPIFVEAAAFQDGTARVRQENGKIHYIDAEANRITKDYQDGSLNFEMQGLFCRVQEDDGTWGIINRKDEMIFSGADRIEELPLITSLGSAIVDGKAVMFELLPFDGDEEIKIIACYDSFLKISCVYSGSFAFVWSEDDLMGVVDYKGDVIVPAKYQKIEFVYLGEELTMDELVFLAHDETGKVHVINARGENL